MTFIKEFKLLLKARYSLLYITTTEEERLEVGIVPGLIRISVGLEHIDDIKKDILRAINNSK